MQSSNDGNVIPAHRMFLIDRWRYRRALDDVLSRATRLPKLLTISVSAQQVLVRRCQLHRKHGAMRKLFRALVGWPCHYYIAYSTLVSVTLRYVESSSNSLFPVGHFERCTADEYTTRQPVDRWRLCCGLL